MPLLLRLSGPAENEEERLVEVDSVLRIGRAEENDLVIADEERTISKMHCVIRREPGGYVVVDSSTNGVFLNEARERLQPGASAPLRTGDSLALGTFRLSVVSVIMPDARENLAASQGGLLGPVSNAPPRSLAEPAAQPPGQDPLESSLGGTPPSPPGHSLEAFLGDADQESWAQPWARPAEPDHTPRIEDGFHNVTPGREAIPSDWDPLAGFHGAAQAGSAYRAPAPSEPPVPEPEPPHPDVFATPAAALAPPPAPSTPASGAYNSDAMRAGIDRILAACGTDPARLSDTEALRAAERTGQLLIIAMDGLLRILGSRGVVKQAFRVERTAISQGANNPMKFTATAAEALRLMLHSDVPGFLPAEEAMREAVGDIQSHQLLLLSAAQEVGAAVLRRLDPTTIEAAMPRQTGDAVPVVRKARAWDTFRTTYARLATVLGEEENALFAEAFGRANAAIQQGRGTAAAKDDPDDN